MTFGYDRLWALVHYSLFDKNRKLLSYIKIPITSCRLLHGFAATEHYIIIPDLPLELSPLHCVTGKHLAQMNKNKAARYGLLKRFSKDPKEIVWFELPSHYCFHFGNAWEENENGEEKVVLWGSKLDDIDFEMKQEHPFLAENWNSKTTRFEFNLTTGEDKMESFFPTKATEFPIVNQHLLCYKTKFMYFIT